MKRNYRSLTDVIDEAFPVNIAESIYMAIGKLCLMAFGVGLIIGCILTLAFIPHP